MSVISTPDSYTVLESMLTLMVDINMRFSDYQNAANNYISECSELKDKDICCLELRHEKEVNDDISEADFIMCSRFASSPGYNFWEGYKNGLRVYYECIFGESDFGDDTYIISKNEVCFFCFPLAETGDMAEMEMLGFHLGVAGKTVQMAWKEGAKGIHHAGLNGNFHKVSTNTELALENIGVKYCGNSKWIVPEGARISLAPEETFANSRQFCKVSDGCDWSLFLQDGSKWVIWSHDIPGLSTTPSTEK